MTIIKHRQAPKSVIYSILLTYGVMIILVAAFLFVNKLLHH